jgi:hypothetical protein
MSFLFPVFFSKSSKDPYICDFIPFETAQARTQGGGVDPQKRQICSFDKASPRLSTKLSSDHVELLLIFMSRDISSTQYGHDAKTLLTCSLLLAT